MAAFFRFFIISFAIIGLAYGTIDPELFNSLRSGERADILVDFKGSNTRAIQAVESRHFRSRLSKVKALSRSLQSTRTRSQTPLINYLEGQGVNYESFWSSNQLGVRNADLNLAKAIDNFPQVNTVNRVPEIPFFPIIGGSNVTTNSSNEYGIEKIMADQVWSQFNISGEGVVVANIDSGVRGTHEALASNWRQDHGWFDPYNFKKEPFDQNGHGTHTMGTIAGQGGIGVAPGAKWIACRGCDDSGCEFFQLLACGQWMLAPTNPDGTDRDESMIPDVICNSWGSSRGGQPFYVPTIMAWTAAGIMHAFALGNSGPLCASGGSPGDQPQAFAVGSTDIEDQLSIFSSKGPGLSIFGGIGTKPEVSAPGSDVRSAWNDADNSYNTISGTSMAAPHVSGIMALMLSAYRQQTGNATARLDFALARKTIEQTAVREGLSLSTLNFACDRNLFGGNHFPNNQFGNGRVNALAAVSAIVNGYTPPEGEN